MSSILDGMLQREYFLNRRLENSCVLIGKLLSKIQEIFQNFIAFINFSINLFFISFSFFNNHLNFLCPPQRILIQIVIHQCSSLPGFISLRMLLVLQVLQLLFILSLDSHQPARFLRVLFPIRIQINILMHIGLEPLLVAP